ncbi:MAG: CHAT domain-containing tetratricopeptide repeat protein [Cyclonatronaceae bacterium]
MILGCACVTAQAAGNGFTGSALIAALPDSTAGEAEVDQANTWIIEAQRNRKQGELEEAQELLGQAREIVERSDDWTINYRYYVENGHLNRTLGNHEEAARSFKNLFNIFTDDDEYIRYKAVNYTNLGVVYRAAGKYDQAMEALENSLEYRYQTPGDSTGLSVTYKSIGEIHRMLRRYEEAYGAYSTALNYIERSHPLQEADLLYAMGIVRNLLGLHSSAKLYFDRVISIAEEEGHQGLLIRGYSGLAEYYSGSGRSVKSRENWLKAIEVLDDARQPALIGLYMRALRKSVELYQEDARESWLEPAEAWILALEDMIEEYGTDRNRGNFHLARGEYYNAIGEYENAETDFVAALDLFEQIPRFRIHPLLYWNRAFNMMELNEARGMEFAEQALLLTDTYRQQVGFSGDVRADYFRNLSPYYARLAQRYIEEGDGETSEAFRVMELNKSRAFAEDLDLQPRFVKNYMEPQQWERYESLRRQIVDAELSGMSIADQPQEQVEALWELEKLTREAENIYSATLDQTPELQQFLAPATISLAEARRQLAPGEAGLQLGIHGQHIMAVLFTEDEARSWLTKIPGTKADEFVNELRGSIVERQPLEQLLPKLEAAGERLFPEAARRMLENSRYLTIATDGSLAYLPFDALRLQERYLGEMLTIRYVPSFTVQKSLEQRQSPPRSGPDEAARALALASPDFGSFDYLPAYLRDESAGLRPLPYSNLEGQWLQEHFYGETTLLTGQEATKERLLEELSGSYDVLHFATHGVLDERSPQLSGIVLARPGNTSGMSQQPSRDSSPAAETPGQNENAAISSFDGFLHMGGIYELSLKSDLVVLSACNTGIGEVVDGEGVMGFKRAFMFAGARSVIVSLWSVQDRSTALLMRAFYQKISEMKQQSPGSRLGSLEYADALQQARLALIRQPSYEHPAYWAAFTITGE